MTIARDIAAWISGSITKKGPVELATQAEVDAGTDVSKILTPGTLRGSSGAITGGLIDVQVYTGNATWTKPAGAERLEVQCIGGGGGGAGVGVPSTPEWRIGGAGGGGASIYAFYNANDFSSTAAVVIGAGGAGGAAGNNAGGAGGTSSFNGTSGTHYAAALGGSPGSFTSFANNIGLSGIGGNANNNVVGELASIEMDGRRGGGGYIAGGEIRGTDGGGTGGGMDFAPAPPLVAASGGIIGGDPRTYGNGGGGAAVKDSVQNRAGTAGQGGIVIVRSYG